VTSTYCSINVNADGKEACVGLERVLPGQAMLTQTGRKPVLERITRAHRKRMSATNVVARECWLIEREAKDNNQFGESCNARAVVDEAVFCGKQYMSCPDRMHTLRIDTVPN
jgi:hypothetical protein